MTTPLEQASDARIRALGADPFAGPAYLDRLAAMAEATALELEAARRAEDLGAGLTPPGAHRALLPHELVARTNFAGMADAISATSAELTSILTQARARFLDLVTTEVAAQADLRAAFRRLLDLRTQGVAGLAGAAEVIDATAVAVEESLSGHALEAADRLRAEAIAQGLPTSAVGAIDVATIDRIEEMAARLAQSPPADLLRALTDEAFVRRMATGTPAELAAQLRGIGGTLSVTPLADYAGSAAAGVEGMARTGEASRVGEPAEVYASELLDSNTCGPCSFIDGTRYPSIEAGRVDYPGGTYRNCEGGPRCRGTLVFVWGTEAPPTIDTEPPPGPPPPPEPPPAPAGPPPTIPDALAPIVSPEDLADAAADLPRIRAELRAHALEVQADAAAFFDASDSQSLLAPPSRRGARDRGGRIVAGSRQAGEWDWFDELAPAEQRRLRRTWVADGPIGPDVMAEHLADRFGLVDYDAAVREWLRNTRRFDAAGAVARGRIPSAAAYGGVDPSVLLDSPWDLAKVFGPDAEAAALHVAEENAYAATEYAARAFRTVRPGQIPPWEMAEADFVEEVTTLEARVAGAVPISDDADFGLTYAPDIEAAFDRLAELIPDGLDDAANPLPPDHLYGAMIALARQAGLVP